MRQPETVSSIFSSDQTVNWKVFYHDSTTTTASQGIGIQLFDIMDSSFNLLSTTYDVKATLDGVLNNSGSTQKLRSVLGYDEGIAKSGVTPNIYQYWAAGAPAGCKIARRVFLKYTGLVRTDDGTSAPVTFVFGGSGKLRFFKNGIEILSGNIREPLVKDIEDIEQDAGYLVVETSVDEGDDLEIYYANNNEPWGGIVAKVIPGHGHTVDWPTFRVALRDAGVVSASFLSADVADEIEIPYCDSALLQAGRNQIPVLQVEVALAPFGEPSGFFLENVGGQNQLIDNRDNTYIIKNGRLINFKGGFELRGYEELYDRFTGKITSITPSQSGETATLTCHGFETVLESQFDENYPDRLSYIAAGFIDREWLGYPVFPVQAFDAWPMETAVAELLYRSGVDSYNLGKSPFSATPSHGKYSYRITETGETYDGQYRFYARSVSDVDELVTLQRNKNYGNIGALRKSYLLNDDPYIYPSQVSDRLYDHVMNITGQFGYDFFFDAAGQATLGSRNNPQSWQYLSTGDEFEEVSPTAVGGTFYRNLCGGGATSWTKQITAFCSRIDLYTGIGYENDSDYNGGVFQVDVEVKDATDSWIAVPEATQQFSTYFAAIPESFLYDDIIRVDGTNASVFTLFNLPFNEYRVTISPVDVDISDSEDTAVIRLNGVAVFEKDPSNSAYTNSLSTLGNLIDFNPSSNEKDLRNHVIVVGQRKATVTDSDKFSQENPNNPFTEFNVSVAADPGSIYDPEAPNFVGGKKVTVVIDDKVTDSDFAKWLARTTLYRYNLPKLDASVIHTAIPTLEVSDPVTISDERDDSIQHVVWVKSFRERWAQDEADVSIDFTSYPELPSFTPREDVDISLFEYSPALNVEINYKNLYGTVVTNPNAVLPVVVRTTAAVASSASHTLPSGAYADDVFLYRDVDGSMALNPDKNVLLNHPYRFFWKVGSNGLTLTFDFQEGDGTTGVYDKTSYGFPTDWRVSYETFSSRTGDNPFYDPYSSEAGITNLVAFNFDSLISGFYRISVWATSPSGDFDFPVAYLTKPEANSEEEEAHWTYVEAGADREYTWDGTDSVGLWNRYQSRDFARNMEGSFDDKPMAVGKGFYAWNDQSTNKLTQIGDDDSDNYGSDNRPYFTKGKYSQFFLKIEAQSDKALRKTGTRTTFSIDTHEDLKILEDSAYVYTHLGEPTQIKINVHDWDPTSGDWTTASVADQWVSDIDSSEVDSVLDAQIRNGKPVKVTFSPVPRRGILFDEDPEKVSSQLFRLVHLKNNVFDQFWTLYGKPWDGDMRDNNKSSKNSSNSQAKRLTSRIHSDDEHAVEFQTQDWLTGTDFNSLEWIFQPDQFEKDFGGGLTEAIVYGDYEQLYSLPGFDSTQGGGTARPDKAYITLAFMNYLFYLSAHTLDRSGRRQWCLSENFIDRSKIVSPDWLAAMPGSNPEYCVDYERFNADTYLARSIVTRQWVEPSWKTPVLGDYLTGSPVDEFTITDAYELSWVQPSILDFDPLTTTLTGGAEDKWITAFTTNSTAVNASFRSKEGGSLKTMDVHTHTYRLTTLGSWNFDRQAVSGWFKPSPCRDFHPYWREPAMPDWATPNPNNVIGSSPSANVLEIPASMYGSSVRDIAAESNWFGYAHPDTFNAGDLNYRGAFLEQDVISWANNADRGTAMAQVFDYMRQDTLNRFDMFRGVISRGPYATRPTSVVSLSYWVTNPVRQAPAAPVAPSGTYLLNLGNYYDYIIGPTSKAGWADIQNYVHMSQDIDKLFDIRFRHEYVWYSKHYFPTWSGVQRPVSDPTRRTAVPRTVTGSGGGGARYWDFKKLTSITSATDAFDSGAWTGHKDDLTSDEWAADSHLRWTELFSLNSNLITQDGTASKPFVGGLYKDKLGGIPADGAVTEAQYILGQAGTYIQRVNFFADTNAIHQPRLAVGPRVPETRSLIMNLVLPARLKG